MQVFSQSVAQITKDFQAISGLVREIETRLLPMDPKAAAKIRGIQDLERQHLEMRVGINERLVKLALGLYELNKQRVIQSYQKKKEESKDEEEYGLDQAEIEEWVAPRAKEIDGLKQQEAKVMQEINEEVEGLRRMSTKRKAAAEVTQKMAQMQITDDNDEY